MWHQSQSNTRLEKLGFAICPGLDNSVGVSAGNVGDPNWLYSLSTSGEAVLACYRRPENHKGWTLVSDTAGGLLFKRGAARMRLQIGNGNAAFVLFDAAQAKPDDSAETDT